jgi:hypothetical protein
VDHGTRCAKKLTDVTRSASAHYFNSSQVQHYARELRPTIDHGGSHTAYRTVIKVSSLQNSCSKLFAPLSSKLLYAHRDTPPPHFTVAMLNETTLSRCFALSVCVLCSSYLQGVASLVLLSDLSTPAFLVDIQLLQQHLDNTAANGANTPIPPINIFGREKKLVPFPMMDLNDDNCPHSFDEKATPVLNVLETPGLCYLHASVVTPRDATQPDQNRAFLATLDLLPNVAAELVLGLNNHHVGSYYWARAAGAGAAMEAPGVVLDAATANLQWESEQGPIACNSNDGKRSEWVNFLRVGDQVQLRPLQLDAQDVLAKYASSNPPSSRIFGVSSKSRPMGSEPAVVCEWRIEG